MGFEKGHKLAKGRIKGSKNKRSLEFQEALDRHNFNPAEALFDLYTKAMVGVDHGNRNEKPLYLKIAADLAKEMASYVYPKLRSVEHIDSNDETKTNQAREMLNLDDQALAKTVRERLMIVCEQNE